MSDYVERTAEFVQSKLEGEGSGHDWWHVQRVWNLAKKLASVSEKKINLTVVELAALLHDIADHKFHNGDLSVGPEVARQWLESLNADEGTTEHVCKIIEDVSFKGAEVETPVRSMEGSIVQDADRLDAIGAIGIARAFAYGGHKSRELYNPDIPPKKHASFEEYSSDKGHTINHFYEKLFLLKDRLNTDQAKKIAEERHRFMEQFVNQFLAEWHSKS